MNSSTSTSGSVPEGLSNQEFLRQFNDQEYKRLTPVVAFMVILLILGILGNSLVLYIYKFRFKRSSSRTYINCLALLDGLTCLIGMPYHFYDMANSLVFYNAGLCKALTFLQTISTLSSIFVLGLISIDRYRKICKPFKNQLSDLGTRAICLFAVIMAAICSTPIIFLYGNSSTSIPGTNVTGTECYFEDTYHDTVYPLVYNGFFLLIFLSSIVAFFVMYGIIGWTILNSSNMVSGSFRGSNRKGVPYGDGFGPESTNTTHDTVSRASEGSIKRIMKAIGNSFTPRHSLDRRQTNQKIEMSEDNNSQIEQAIPLSPVGNIVKNSPSLKAKNSPMQKSKRKFNLMRLRNMSTASESEDDSPSFRRHQGLGGENSGAGAMNRFSRKHRRSVRITLILFCVTLVFVISFLPYLVVVFMTEMDEDFWMIGSENSPTLHFLIRSYFFNNVANPFIYLFLDKRFRLEVAFLFHRLTNCKK